MKLIYNSVIPFRGFTAINLFGFVFVRTHHISATLLNHEYIHTLQMCELGYVPFYILYLLEWLVRLPFGNAYRKISFEREAYRHQYDDYYLSNRRHFSQWRK